MTRISRQQLIQEMAGDLDARVYRPSDEEYVCPSEDWLREFMKGVPLRAPSFVSEAFDCDNFAKRAVVQADEALLRSGASGVGHTFGYCEVMMTPGMTLNGITAPKRGTHAANICRTNDGTWWFAEPQTGAVCRFSDRPAGIVLAFVWL